MKKKLILIPLLALVLVASMGIPVLAWDVEDPCVADNEDFIFGSGWVNGVGEFYGGEQPWPYPKAPSEGYNLYRDDVTDTGNLGSVFILTFTPDAIDLPIIAEYYSQDIGTYWYMGEESSDTYYWDTEPRGYDFTKANVLEDSGIPGKGLDTAPGLDKQFNPNSQAGNNAGKK